MSGAPEPEAPFAEPWQAEAFALAVALSNAGHFSWHEWSETLGAELADGQTRTAAWAAAYRATPHGKPVTL